MSCTCTVLPVPRLVSNEISFTVPERGILVVIRHSHTTFIIVLFSLILPIVHGTDFLPYVVISAVALNLRKFYPAFNKFIVH